MIETAYSPYNSLCRKDSRTYWPSWLNGRLSMRTSMETPTRGQCPGPRRSSDVAPVAEKVVLLAPRVRRVHPPPHTVTSSLGTCRQVGRDLEIDVLLPGTAVIRRYHDKVLRFDLFSQPLSACILPAPRKSTRPTLVTSLSYAIAIPHPVTSVGLELPS